MRCPDARPAVPALACSMLLVLACGPSRPAMDTSWLLPAPADSLVLRAQADSTDPEALVLAGYTHWNAERWGDAARLFRRALDYNPRYAPAHLGLALLPFAREPALDEAMHRGEFGPGMQDTIQAAFDHYRLAALFNPLAEFGPPGMPPDTTRYFVYFGDLGAQGIFAYQRRNYERAARAFDIYVARTGAQKVPGAVLWYRALAHAQLGRYQPGVESLRALLTRSAEEEALDSTGSPVPFLVTNDVRYALAYFQEHSGAMNDAIRTYQQVLTSDLGYWMAHVRMADLEERFRRFDRAVAERERALALRPDDLILQREYAVTLGRAGRLAEADSLLARLAERSPWDPWTPYYRGEVAWLLGNRDAARVAYERFLALAPQRLDSLRTDVRLKLEVLQ